MVIMIDCDTADNWVIAVGQGSISLDTTDYHEPTGSVRGNSTNPSAQAFGLKYDFGVGTDMSKLQRFSFWAKMSTKRGGTPAENTVALTDTSGNVMAWYISPIETYWMNFSFHLKTYDYKDPDFDITQVRYIEIWQSDVESGDKMWVDLLLLNNYFFSARK